MAGEFDPAIQRLTKDIEELDRALREKKRMVNQLCEYAGRAAMFANVDESETVSLGTLRPDQFYGKPLATAIREYLEMRKASNIGAATVREIYDALEAGGFKFDAKDATNAQRGLRQSLTKNSTTFHKLPNGTYGLREWYPGVRPARADSNGDASEKSSADDADTPSAEVARSSDVPDTDEGLGASEPTNERR